MPVHNSYLIGNMSACGIVTLALFSTFIWYLFFMFAYGTIVYSESSFLIFVMFLGPLAFFPSVILYEELKKRRYRE
jgi:hypothetical protein